AFLLSDQYFRAGQIEKAIKAGEQALDSFRQVVGPEHPNTMATIEYLAAYYQAGKLPEKAAQLHEELIGLRMKTSGEEHVDVARAIKVKTDGYAASGKWTEARQELLRLAKFKIWPEEADLLLMALAALDVHLGERASYDDHRK